MYQFIWNIYSPLFIQIMKIQHVKWVYLAILSLVWGSSYILIKWGLVALSPLQLGVFAFWSQRLLYFSSAIRLYKDFQNITGSGLPLRAMWVPFSLPFYLLLHSNIDSAIAAILNALTPLLTIIFGLLFFKIDILKKQYFGVGIGLLGSIGLVWGGLQTASNINPIYTLLILAASCCYAMNIHFIKSTWHKLG